MVFLGDSITQGIPKKNNPFAKYFVGLSSINLGIGADRIEHVLYRLRNDQLGNLNPRLVVLHIGINNIGIHKPRTIANGIYNLVLEINRQRPSARVLVVGLLPTQAKRTKMRRKIRQVNDYLQLLDNLSYVEFHDSSRAFISGDQSISERLLYDGIHPTAKGYRVWANDVGPVIKDLLQI